MSAPEISTPYCEVVDRPIATVPVPHYSGEEHGTWALLLGTQKKLIAGRACDEFIEGLGKLDFPADRIPRLVDVSARLQACTGWRLLRVEGLVHPRDFFALLARKIFPATDFIRKRSELMYTPAPDMFHDLFGHTPLLTNAGFTEFFEHFGRVGVEASKRFAPEHEIHDRLQRIYWFTVEFGLLEHHGQLRAYGSGSVSSPKELEFSVGSECRRHPFRIAEVEKQSFDIWHLQEDVFVIDSFARLGKDFRNWARAQGLAL